LALTPADNEAFFREVDEELRRSQLQTLAQRYAIAAAAAVVLILAAIGGYFWWDQHREAKAAEQAKVLTDAFTSISTGDTKTSGPKLDQLIRDGNPGYRATARLAKAYVALQANKDAEAIAAYKEVAGDKASAPAFKDLSMIRQTALEYDKLQPQVVIDRMKPLAVAGGPWFGSAGEMLAIAYMRQGKPELAAPIFAAMAKDTKVPDSVRARALQMAQSLGADTGQGATRELSK